MNCTQDLHFKLEILPINYADGGVIAPKIIRSIIWQILIVLVNVSELLRWENFKGPVWTANAYCKSRSFVGKSHSAFLGVRKHDGWWVGID